MAIITGTPGDDLDLWKLQGTPAADTMLGLGGADEIVAGGGNDLLDGGAGADYLDAGSGNDTLTGGAGADNLNGGSGIDTASYAGAGQGVGVALHYMGVSGEAARDQYLSIENVTGSSFRDQIYGDAGDNRLSGGGGGDDLAGNGGDDRLEGGVGNDYLSGGDGMDDLLGGTGRDGLRGGAGRDELTGGAGPDRFIYAALADSGTTGGTRDVILDFSKGQGDKLAFAGPTFYDQFEFVGTAAFSGAGEVRFRHVDGNTRVEVNADADAAAEMHIVLAGQIDLAGSDVLFLID
jgi:Ca2+-binding RTX toxin-like protein